MVSTEQAGCGGLWWVLHQGCLTFSLLEYVTLQGKRDFVEVIEFRILGWGDYPGLPGGPNVIMKVLLGEMKEDQKSEEKAM